MRGEGVVTLWGRGGFRFFLRSPTIVLALSSLTQRCLRVNCTVFMRQSIERTHCYHGYCRYRFTRAIDFFLGSEKEPKKDRLTIPKAVEISVK